MNIQIEENDFVDKARIYEDFLANMKQQDNGILIFKCDAFQDYLLKIDKDMPQYIKILFYLYLKMQSTDNSLQHIFVQLLKEKSEGIYVAHINNYTIKLNGLKLLFYLKKNKIQQTINKLYNNSKQFMVCNK